MRKNVVFLLEEEKRKQLREHLKKEYDLTVSQWLRKLIYQELNK